MILLGFRSHFSTLTCKLYRLKTIKEINRKENSRKNHQNRTPAKPPIAKPTNSLPHPSPTAQLIASSLISYKTHLPTLTHSTHTSTTASTPKTLNLQPQPNPISPSPLPRRHFLFPQSLPPSHPLRSQYQLRKVGSYGPPLSSEAPRFLPPFQPPASSPASDSCQRPSSAAFSVRRSPLYLFFKLPRHQQLLLHHVLLHHRLPQDQ